MFFCIHLILMLYMVQVFQGLGFSGSRVFKDRVEVLKVALPQMDDETTSMIHAIHKLFFSRHEKYLNIFKYI